MGDRDAALAAADRGIAIADASGESEVRLLPSLLVVRGEALLEKGQAAAANASCGRALALQEKQGILGPDKIEPEAEDALTCIGESLMALGRFEDALGPLERSVSLTKRESPTELARARSVLARARELAAGARRKPRP